MPSDGGFIDAAFGQHLAKIDSPAIVASTDNSDFHISVEPTLGATEGRGV